MTKQVETGQKLYFFMKDANNVVKYRTIYVLDHNKSSIYFGDSPSDRKDSYNKIKTSGSFPCRYSLGELLDYFNYYDYYISDDESFSEKLEKESKDRSELKRDIQEYINDLTYHDHSNEDLRKVRDFLHSVI